LRPACGQYGRRLRVIARLSGVQKTPSISAFRLFRIADNPLIKKGKTNKSPHSGAALHQHCAQALQLCSRAPCGTRTSMTLAPDIGAWI
jgi:hypothetical protein